MSTRADAAAACAPARGAAPLFAALGDETRLGSSLRLCDGRAGSIARLSAQAAVSRQAITKHLDVLGEAGLVAAPGRGRERVWELEPQRLDDARRYLDQISRQWDDALERLRRFVED